MNNQFSTPGFLWPLLSLICLAIFFIGFYATLKKTNRRRLKGTMLFLLPFVFSVLWIAIFIRLSSRGFFADFTTVLPRPALLVLIPLPVVLIFAFSKTGSALLRVVPGQWLIIMQSFRLFVELLLWFAFLSRKLPAQMTFEGGNLDFITGLFALPVGYFCFIKKRWPTKYAVAFNILGLVLLINILVIAVLSMPGPLRVFDNEPSGHLLGGIPFIVLPGILVPLAYTLHIFSLRQLLLSRSHQKPAGSAIQTTL